MSLIQVAIMASSSRPTIQAAALERLTGPGELFAAPLARTPRVYHAGPVPRGSFASLRAFRVLVTHEGRPYLPAFWEILEDARPDADLLFLENDVWIVSGGVPRIAALEVPATVGAVSFFDTRNESEPKHPTLRPLPIGRPLWGSQAVLFPARVLEGLAELARRRVDFGHENSWDIWLGVAVESLGLRVALHSPSLVQHLGVGRSEVFPDDPYRPVALDFPESCPGISEPIIGPPCDSCLGVVRPFKICGRCGRRGVGARR